MAPRTAVTLAVPIAAPTSCTPASAVTMVFRTRCSTPTAMISLPLIALWIARWTRWASAPRGALTR
jgi:hypothetical protein